MGAILMIGAVLLVVALFVAALAFVIGRSWVNARMAASVAAGTVILYGAALVVVSVASPARTLAVGEWKCFDDWCASVTSVSRTGDSVTVVLSVQNQGRREQAPDTPRVWLIRNGHREEVIVPGLNARVPGGSVRRLPTMALTAPASESPQLVVTEGGFPSRLVIGDDNSPFHPQPAWALT
jgi:hypothetical protein